MTVQNKLQGNDAVEKMKEIFSDIRFGMLCTNLSNFPIATCPMTLQEVDSQGRIWFFSGADSDHNADIKKDDRVQLIFSKPSDDIYLSVAGHAEIVTDRAKIAELMNPFAEAWFPGGKDDPNVTLVKVNAIEGQYWSSKDHQFVQMAKMALSYVKNEKVNLDSENGSLKF